MRCNEARRPIMVVTARGRYAGFALAYADGKGYLIEFKKGNHQWVPTEYVKERTDVEQGTDSTAQ